MELVATLRGKQVLSDKPGGIITQGNRVTFEDGSWLDVASGDFENKGPGNMEVITLGALDGPGADIAVLSTTDLGADSSFWAMLKF